MSQQPNKETHDIEISPMTPSHCRNCGASGAELSQKVCSHQPDEADVDGSIYEDYPPKPKKQPDELSEILEDMFMVGVQHSERTIPEIDELQSEAKQCLLSWRDKAVREARIDVRNEVKAKIEALDKLIMGAGEYHDDPYEYVVPLRHIKEYRAELSQFDLTQPVYKNKSLQDNQPKEGV